MVQGGDPQGTGMGDPGYKFPDEFVDSIGFDEPYLLAMANSGPGTNGTLVVLLTSCQEQKENKIFANFETDKGNIKVELFYEAAPMTVANFVGLAEGTMKNTAKGEGEPYFDGLNFHRVITKGNGDQQDFMIQGGDPEGTGQGGPGYQFPNEIVDTLKFDEPGILAMANAGPNTNGSQFFITVAATPQLYGSYSVFGKVVEGLDIVNMIKKD
eukprot:maker-scaffold5376_size4697-snap-gene-0.0 protein:Tk03388 transcript:maker-scaffold5376_size4697-snap-gene-0.0-mRNA-1 annotation:"peptidylprolyl isomerase"